MFRAEKVGRNVQIFTLKRAQKTYFSNGTSDLSKEQQHNLPVSTTRGTPSASTNLKEAFCEKIPIYYDLIRNFREQYGSSVISRITVENLYRGLKGVNGLVKETSEADAKHGIKYRGLTIPEVITLLPREGKAPRVEAVFWLLLTGDVPTQEQTASLVSDWSQRRQRKRHCWSSGGTLRSVLENLPKTITPSAKLSVALTVLDGGRHSREAVSKGTMTHTFWEYTYEDSMELLATLPAIIGLVVDGREMRPAKPEADWVDFLLECLPGSFSNAGNRTDIGDFLRLYITLNANYVLFLKPLPRGKYKTISDEDGVVPGGRVTEILGASLTDVNRALAAGVSAYENAPSSGTMQQYMELQRSLRRILGQEPKEASLKEFTTALIGKDKLVGYKDTRDPRYMALLNYAREAVPNDTHVKLSQDITRILSGISKAKKGGNIYPEQTCIAAPIFQAFGWSDMRLNQLILCASRALGSIASLIFARAVNLPVEQPRSKSTYSYLEIVRGSRRQKRRKHGSELKINRAKINE